MTLIQAIVYTYVTLVAVETVCGWTEMANALFFSGADVREEMRKDPKVRALLEECPRAHSWALFVLFAIIPVIAMFRPHGPFERIARLFLR